MRESGAAFAGAGTQDSGMRDFRKIIAWQKAHAFSIALGSAVDWKKFRKRPGLRAQLLRAVDSISANTAEGCGKRSDSEFARYLEMALSSAREVDNHLLKARDVGCTDASVADRLLADLDEVKRVLFAFERAVRRRI